MKLTAIIYGRFVVSLLKTTLSREIKGFNKVLNSFKILEIALFMNRKFLVLDVVLAYDYLRLIINCYFTSLIKR